MGATNITAVVLTLNEAENIQQTLDSADPIFDELVLVDGDSDDDTVGVAREWCTEHGKRFDVLHSNEREYLLEGPATQRRRGEALATCDYTLALGADVVVDVKDEAWFEQDFEHYAYEHTRVRKGGYVASDWRLYRPDPPVGVDESDAVRWRGMVHEELRDLAGEHVSDCYTAPPAPMVHHQQRHGAMETDEAFRYHKHGHRPESDGNTSRALKKQHFLLRQVMGSEQQKAYLDAVWHSYYNRNTDVVLKHWNEIRREFDIPAMGFYSEPDPDEVHSHEVKWWDLKEDHDPVIRNPNGTFVDYARDKLWANES